jgi:hypothetical protein
MTSRGSRFLSIAALAFLPCAFPAFARAADDFEEYGRLGLELSRKAMERKFDEANAASRRSGARSPMDRMGLGGARLLRGLPEDVAKSV